MGLCRLCAKRPGKRACPALGYAICAVCCGRDRMIEIVCPESCVHLRSGREHARAREREQRAKEMSALGRATLRPSRAQIHVLAAAETTLVTLQRDSLRDLDDQDVLAALENATKNIETASSGLIYEHPEDSGRAREVSKHLRENLDKLRVELPSEDQPHLSDMLEALRFLTDIVRGHIARGEDPRSYLRYTALNAPYEERQRNQLIVP